MLWYGKGNGVSATLAAWLNPRFPSEITCAILLRMGGDVLHMSPADSYFWRAMSRRMIQDSTIATRARESTGAPEPSASSTPRISSGRPPSTFRTRVFTPASFEAKPETMFLDDELFGEWERVVILVEELGMRFERSGSRRRCCRARACMRLKSRTSSSKNATWSLPRNSASLGSLGLGLSPRSTEDCRNGVHTSPFASNADAMHAPSNHFAPILCTASRASQ
mmetsp:Transcript_81519/g.242979  ORF Transcript_81519/g.242979 Transcript_81519/m.242979 type:complete len:223 (+) Transcript_81519:334-1002(+)